MLKLRQARYKPLETCRRELLRQLPKERWQDATKSILTGIRGGTEQAGGLLR